LRTKGGLVNPHVKDKIKETFYWEFLGLPQHIGLIPLHEPQNLLLIPTFVVYMLTFLDQSSYHNESKSVIGILDPMKDNKSDVW
jgi:hypothetical protein